VKEDIIEVGGVTHIKVRHLINSYQHHTQLSISTNGLMKRLGPRLRKRFGIAPLCEGKMSGLFIPESKVVDLLTWLSKRHSAEEYNELVMKEFAA
jgi:hypothetical protein